MNFDELHKLLNPQGKAIIATLIKPVRNGEYFTKGQVVGFKYGTMGPKLKGNPRGSCTITSPCVIKNDKVLIQYNVFQFGKGTLTDWVEANNCIFEII